MLRPVLFIGVGGAGGKTLRTISNSIAERLVTAGYTEGIPESWQFLHIDTTLTQDGIGYPEPLLKQEQFVSVVSPGMIYRNVVTKVMDENSIDEQHKLLAGWAIPVSTTPIRTSPTSQRALGRLVGLDDIPRISQALQNSISKMNSAMAMRNLKRISELLPNEEVIAQPLVFIISSIVGRSGSGMFMDISEILRNSTSEPWASNPNVLLYTPDVFNEVGHSRSDLAFNALGVFNEICAISPGEVSTSSRYIAEAMGLSTGVTSQREIKCFMIGTMNSAGIDISSSRRGNSMEESFRFVGRSLASTIFDGQSLEFFVNATTGILPVRSSIDTTGFATHHVNRSSICGATGIGFSQISLGMSYFRKYVAHAMTHAQVRKMLWPDLEPLEFFEITNRDARVSSEIDRISPKFIQLSGLDQRGESNQIIKSLAIGDINIKLDSFVNQLIESKIPSNQETLGNFAQKVWNQWDRDSREFMSSLSKELEENFEMWIDDVQQKLTNSIALTTFENGYEVVIGALKRLAIQLEEYSFPELQRECHDLNLAVSSFDEHGFDLRLREIANGAESVDSSSSELFNKLRDSLKRVLEFSYLSKLYGMASEVVQGIINSYLQDTIKEVEHARYSLSLGHKNSMLIHGPDNFYGEFPVWGSGKVPSQFMPGISEHVLIRADNFERLFEEYAEDFDGFESKFDGAVRNSLFPANKDVSKSEINMQTLIKVVSKWNQSQWRPKGKTSEQERNPLCSYLTDISQLIERNIDFLSRAESRINDFCNISIRDYVLSESEGGAIQAERKEEFLSHLRAAISCVQPMAPLNLSALARSIQTVDGLGAEIPLIKPVQLPFGAETPFGDSCISILRAYGIDTLEPGFNSKWFNPVGNSPSLNFLALNRQQLPFWAFRSLTESIREKFKSVQYSPQVLNSVWEGRRARPLTESIPFDAEIRKSLVTGWFIASLFGLRDIKHDLQGLRIRIWNSTLPVPSWSDFPETLLPAFRQRGLDSVWALPSLLTSAGIAFCEFGSTDDSKHLEPYQFLLYIGREVTTTFKDRDEWSHNGVGEPLPNGEIRKSTVLADWVRDGTPPSMMTLPDFLINSSRNRSESRETLKARCLATKEKYRNEWARYVGQSWADVPETWELREDIDLALSNIHDYLDSLAPASDFLSN